MSRSCHSATSSTPGLGVAAEHAGEPGDLLGLDRVALVGHRARALLAGAERLADLGDLGPGEVAELGREPLEPGTGERDRLEQLGVAVARDDLGRDRLGGRSRRGSTRRSNSGEVARVRADRARTARRPWLE